MCVVLKDLGMAYNTIDVCPNDHIRYYGQQGTQFKCPICGISRYKIDQVISKCEIKIHKISSGWVIPYNKRIRKNDEL